MAVVPACCADEHGVREAIRGAKEQLKESEYVRAKEVMERMMYYAVKKSDYIAYGRERALRALEMGVAEAAVAAEELGEDAVLEVIMKAEEKGVKVEVVPRGVEESKTLMQAFGATSHCSPHQLGCWSVERFLKPQRVAGGAGGLGEGCPAADPRRVCLARGRSGFESRPVHHPPFYGFLKGLSYGRLFSCRS